MSMELNVIIWGILLGVCRMYNVVEFVGEVVKYLIKLELIDIGNFFMLFNIYVVVGDWVNVANVRLFMKGVGV